ncbi:MAG: NADH-quinone oxidoreductase subunit L [Bacteroidota bacterium]|nr:NADH-quinone oxidoreductase subunit L [Bacteroidota bacterium]
MNNTTIYIILILLFPLAGFLINAFLNKNLPGKISGIIGSIAVFVPLILSLIIFINLKKNIPAQTIYLSQWIITGQINIPFEFLIDPLSVLMMLVVTGVGTVIHIYSIGYMHSDNRIHTFFSWMNLFIFFMLILITGANYLIMFIGWEGVGLCSYLLIGFWFKNNEFNYAARKAFIMNRIGDLGFLIALFLMIINFETLSFNNIFTAHHILSQDTKTITIITLLLLVGAVGKSAQIPLYTWLPDAMAGPTPVSALIHAATMVAAGVYMIVRSNLLFRFAPLTMDLIIIIGITTALLSATIALYQEDIKKVLAYSTISQLGYMFLALGLGAYSSAMFHLTTHAFFKALLFLAAGSIIHALNGEQNLRMMGGLAGKLPVTFITFLIAALAISGIPPFSGFFSKDQILLNTFNCCPSLWIFAVLGSILTCIYIFRVFYLAFYGEYRGNSPDNHDDEDIIKPDKDISALHESPLIMTIPLIILAVLSLAGGFINLPQIFGGNNYLDNYLAIESAETGIDDTTEYFLISTTVIVVLIMIIIVWFRYTSKPAQGPKVITEMNFIEKMVYNKFYVDELYRFLFEKPYDFLSEKLLPTIEKGTIDKTVNSAGTLSLTLGSLARKIQNGNISFYILLMTLAAIAFLAINVFIL